MTFLIASGPSLVFSKVDDGCVKDDTPGLESFSLELTHPPPGQCPTPLSAFSQNQAVLPHSYGHMFVFHLYLRDFLSFFLFIPQ